VGQAVLDQSYAETVFEAFGTSRSVDRSQQPPLVQNNLDPKWITMGGGAQGVLERTPHNNVHNNIGAFMPTPASPRDPIFMMHHGNIDRIWAHWNALGRLNSTDSLWLDMPFTNNYIKPDGTTYTKVVRELLNIADLGYTYDVMPSQPAALVADAERSSNLLALLSPEAGKTPTGMQRLETANTAAARASAPLSLPFELKRETLKAIAGAGAAAPARRKPEVVALITDIMIGNDVQAIRVFLNHPNLSDDVPDTDPHYVTTLAFLADAPGTHHGSRPSAIVNLTDTIKALAKSNVLTDDKLTVQLLPVPVEGVPLEAVGTVVPATVEIAVI
jgi:tyrosinase